MVVIEVVQFVFKLLCALLGTIFFLSSQEFMVHIFNKIL